MTTRELFRALLPPVAARWGGRLLGLQAPVGKYCRLRAYETFEAALAESDSYAHADIVDLVARRTETYRQALRLERDKILKTRQSTQNVFVLSQFARKRPLDVLELGGACGATFFEMDHLLPGAIRAWHVAELPETAEAARRGFEDKRLRFFDDLDAAVQALKGRDFLMTQGGLQCVREPMVTLDRLLRFGFTYVYVTRFEVSDNLQEPVVVRLLDKLSANGPGPMPAGFVDRNTSYPATLFPADALLSRVPANYRVAFRFEETEPRVKLIQSRRVTTRKIGLLLERLV